MTPPDVKTYPEIPFMEDRANHLLRELDQCGPEGAVRALADYTALTRVHTFNPPAEPLSEAQAVAVGRWIHALADAAFRRF